MNSRGESIVYMMMFSFLVSFFLISTSFAAICFSNEDEYSNIKKDLPKILQAIPIYFTGTLLNVKGAGSVQFFNQNIRFSFNSTNTARPLDPQVKNICVDQGVATLTFFNHTEDGTTDKMKNDPTTQIPMVIAGDNYIKLQEIFFMKKVDAAAYMTMAAEISLKTNMFNKPLPDSPATGVTK